MIIGWKGLSHNLTENSLIEYRIQREKFTNIYNENLTTNLIIRSSLLYNNNNNNENIKHFLKVNHEYVAKVTILW